LRRCTFHTRCLLTRGRRVCTDRRRLLPRTPITHRRSACPERSTGPSFHAESQCADAADLAADFVARLQITRGLAAVGHKTLAAERGVLPPTRSTRRARRDDGARLQRNAEREVTHDL